MNYLFVYSGNLPTYALTSINTVLSVDEKANVILCTDKKHNFPYITNITFDEVESDLTRTVKNINYFKNEKNPLWSTSLLRIFYLNDISHKLELDGFIHFDTDVLIYKSYDDLKNYMDKSKFNITSLSELDLIFSYSFTENIDCFEEICTKLLEILKNPSFYEDKYYESKKLNEMMLLNIVYIENNHLFNILPTIPNVNAQSNIIFDSITYGQYLSGVHNSMFSKHIIEENSYVGRFLLRESTKVRFNNIPFINYKKRTYELANLHVHSKKLEKYLPKEYKCKINY